MIYPSLCWVYPTHYYYIRRMIADYIPSVVGRVLAHTILGYINHFSLIRQQRRILFTRIVSRLLIYHDLSQFCYRCLYLRIGFFPMFLPMFPDFYLCLLLGMLATVADATTVAPSAALGGDRGCRGHSLRVRSTRPCGCCQGEKQHWISEIMVLGNPGLS